MKFRDLFEESKQNHTLISVYLYGDVDDKFWLGTVIGYNKHLVALSLFGLYGIYDGTIILAQEDIESIEYNTKYTTAYQYLLENTESKKAAVQFTLPDAENWQFELLKSLDKDAAYLAIGIDVDAAVFGKLVSFDEDHITLIPISKLGEADGFATYNVADITDFHFNRAEDLKRQKLYEWRLNKKA